MPRPSAWEDLGGRGPAVLATRGLTSRFRCRDVARSNCPRRSHRPLAVRDAGRIDRAGAARVCVDDWKNSAVRQRASTGPDVRLHAALMLAGRWLRGEVKGKRKREESACRKKMQKKKNASAHQHAISFRCARGHRGRWSPPRKRRASGSRRDRSDISSRHQSVSWRSSSRRPLCATSCRSRSC